MERLAKLRVISSDADVPFTLHRLSEIALVRVKLEILSHNIAEINLKVTGTINQINEFKNEFTIYDCARKFSWEDIHEDS